MSGFKALNDVTFEVPGRLLVLIGANGAGKSSTLQALGLIREFARGNAGQFFDDRDWERKEVRSSIPPSDPTFRADILLDDSSGNAWLWQINWGLSSGTTVRERVWLKEHGSNDPALQLDYERTKSVRIWGEDLGIKGIKLRGSVISFIEPPEEPDKPDLTQVVDWALGITSLELLSPTSMRRMARGDHQNIGARGERLGSFLANLDASAKARIVERMSRFYPIANVETTRKRAGWVDIRVAEVFSDIAPLRISQVSDGFLRLLALCAIPEFKRDVSLVLLDEIEDGIEPHILPDVLRMIIEDTAFSLLVTSHSPLLVNFASPTEVVLLGRRQAGAVMQSPLSKLSGFGEGLEYFGGGELWTMMSRDTLAQALEAEDAQPEDPSEPPPRFSSRYAHWFMQG